VYQEQGDVVVPQKLAEFHKPGEADVLRKAKWGKKTKVCLRLK